MVSACLLGERCKYNGGHNLNQRVVAYVAGHEVIAVCPEMLAGAGVPRECVEIVNGKITTVSGRDVDGQYRRGVDAAMERARDGQIDLAVLQSRSPTCGVNQIYNGTFSGRLVPGSGIFAAALMESGIQAVDAEDI